MCGAAQENARVAVGQKESKRLWRERKTMNDTESMFQPCCPIKVLGVDAIASIRHLHHHDETLAFNEPQVRVILPAQGIRPGRLLP
jgi:hypothetical protein